MWKYFSIFFFDMICANFSVCKGYCKRSRLEIERDLGLYIPTHDALCVHLSSGVLRLSSHSKHLISFARLLFGNATSNNRFLRKNVFDKKKDTLRQ